MTIPNLRTVGQLRSAGGRLMHPALLIRSAAPYADDIPPASCWPPALVIDLRWDGESTMASPFVPPTRVVRAPMPNSLVSGLLPGEGLPEFYRRIVDGAGESLVRIVHEVSRATGPTLIHCSAGKDRTGIAIALLLTLLGVSREDIVDDYLASAAAAEEVAKRLLAERGATYRSALPWGIFAVSAEAIESVLDRWAGHDGGAAGWLVDEGAEARTIDDLRSSMLTSP